MERRRLLAAGTGAAAGAVAACLGSGDPDPSRLELTVRNDGDDPVDVTAEGDDGTTYGGGSDRIDAGVARTSEVVAGECADSR